MASAIKQVAVHAGAPMKKPRRSLDDLLSLVVVAFALLCMSALLFDLQTPTDTAAANVHPTPSQRA
jgi:hypothetical protein